MLNPNLKSINRRKRVKVDLKILRGRILKFFHNRKSEVILGVFCKNQFDSQSLGGGIFDRLQLFSRTKFRVLSDFQVQNEKITIFPIFRSSFPLFATMPPFRNTFSESLGVAKRGTTGVFKKPCYILRIIESTPKSYPILICTKMKLVTLQKNEWNEIFDFL